MKKIFTMLVLTVVLAISIPLPVSAQNQGGNSSGGNPNAGTGVGNTESLHGGTGSGAGNQTQTGQDGAVTTGNQGGLSAERKQTCENRKGNIDKTMTQYSATIQNRLMLFNKIAERVQTYYLQNNLNVADYEQLMTQVNAQQQLATQAMQQVRQNAYIDCGANDPVGTAQQLRTHIQTAQQTLDQYRLAIHNLLTAVINATQ